MATTVGLLLLNLALAAVPPAVASGTRHVYYNGQQAIEERVGTSSSADQQFVWNLGYVDDLVLRDYDTNGNGTLDQRLYALTDLRFSVMALANTSGSIVERFQYDAHGVCTVMDSNFVVRSSTNYAWSFRYTGRREDLSHRPLLLPCQILLGRIRTIPGA